MARAAMLLRRPPQGYRARATSGTRRAARRHRRSPAQAQTGGDHAVVRAADRRDAGRRAVAGTRADRRDGASRAARVAAMGRGSHDRDPALPAPRRRRAGAGCASPTTRVVGARRGAARRRRRRRSIAVAPADAVTLHWAELPDRSPAQAMAAARHPGRRGQRRAGRGCTSRSGDEASGERPIGGGRGDADARLARGAGGGRRSIPPRCARAAAAAAPGRGLCARRLGGQAVVRGATSGFADEARLTALVTGGARRRRSGATRSRRRSSRRWRRPRSTCGRARSRGGGGARSTGRWSGGWRCSAALILLATLAIDLVRIAQILARRRCGRGARRGAGARRACRAARRGRCRAAARRAAVAAARAGRGVQRDRGGGVRARCAASAGTELTALDFEPNGDLRATIAAEGEAQAIELVSAAARRGLRVTAEHVRDAGGRVRGELTVSAP